MNCLFGENQLIFVLVGIVIRAVVALVCVSVTLIVVALVCVSVALIVVTLIHIVLVLVVLIHFRL